MIILLCDDWWSFAFDLMDLILFTRAVLDYADLTSCEYDLPY